MKAEVKAQLIADLRSGEYRQGHGVLRRDGGSYCCLGVLCEQARRSGVALTTTPYGYRDENDFQSCLTLTHVVRHWSGMHYGLQTKMIELNDKDRKTFPEIADFLEVCDDEGNVPE